MVKTNGFANIIEVHRTYDGDDQRQIDIIVSEWMGFYLLHEVMLDSVIFARDKFIKSNGSMFPQNTSIHIAQCVMRSLFDA